MERKKLEHAIQVVRECTERLLSENVRMVKRYTRYYTDIQEYCQARDVYLRTQEEFDEICRFNEYRRPYGKKEFRKAAYMVFYYISTGQFCWKRVPSTRFPVPTIYRDIFDSFQKVLSKSLRPSTLRVEASPVKHFLCYLYRNGMHDLYALTDAVVWDFVHLIKPRYPACMGRVLRALKKFLSHLQAHNIVKLDVERFLVAPAAPRKKILPCLSADEIFNIFSVINCKSAKGIRDYAVFLLALRLGLRASDIVNMKMSDIDWRNNSIYITQQKTATSIVLPLPADVGNAIAKYILEARPKVDSPYLFLRTTKLLLSTPLSTSAFNKYLRQYMSMAGVVRKGWDGKSFHSLRRTAGTNMLKAGAPLLTISQVLGHKNIEATKHYLSLNTEHMRKCCLDLGYLHTGKEGLR